jgi:PAS domain S-box-containing protein
VKAPYRILVVEDEQIVALELKHRLSGLGYSVCAMVATGEAAIDSAEHLRPDLVLMDIKLQGEMDGVEAAEVIRSRMDIPVVYLTAYADDRTLERVKATEPYGYIIKPFHERELHVVIEVALYRHEAVRRLRESEAWRNALLDSAGDAVLAVGSDGRIKLMNRLAEALTGWKESDAIGLDLDRVLKLVDCPEKRSPPWREAPYQKLIARNGSERPIEMESAPIRDAGGRALGVVNIFRDISERKRLQDWQRFMAIASREVSSSLVRDDILTKLTDLIVHSRNGPSRLAVCRCYLREGRP